MFVCGFTYRSPEYSAAVTREDPPAKRRVVFDEVSVENPEVEKIVGDEAILDPRGSDQGLSGSGVCVGEESGGRKEAAEAGDDGKKSMGEDVSGVHVRVSDQGEEVIDELNYQLSHLELDPAHVEEPFVPDWNLKEGSRLAYPPICKNLLVNVAPPVEVDNVQHADSSVLHDNISTALTTLVVSYREMCRREAHYEGVVKEVLDEGKMLRKKMSEVAAQAGAKVELETERDELKKKSEEMVEKYLAEVTAKALITQELVKVKSDLIKETDARMSELSKHQGMINNKTNQVRQLRMELEAKDEEREVMQKKMSEMKQEVDRLQKALQKKEALEAQKGDRS